MKSASLGRLTLAIDLGGKPGEYSILGLSLFHVGGEAGIHLSVLQHHLFAIVRLGDAVTREMVDG